MKYQRESLMRAETIRIFLCRRFLLKFVTQNKSECVTHHRNTKVNVQNKQIINYLFNDVNEAAK